MTSHRSGDVFPSQRFGRLNYKDRSRSSTAPLGDHHAGRQWAAVAYARPGGRTELSSHLAPGLSCMGHGAALAGVDERGIMQHDADVDGAAALSLAIAAVTHEGERG